MIATYCIVLLYNYNILYDTCVLTNDNRYCAALQHNIDCHLYV